MEKVPSKSAKSESAEKAGKTFLYHMVPEDMRGTTLYPLNDLKEKHPDLFVSESEKYGDRPEVMQEFIPTLAAKWNDVLQFTAVHPQDLKQALIDAGMNPHEMKFFEVDPDLLDPKVTTVYLYNDAGAETRESSFAAFEPDKLKAHSQIPEVTRQYYKESLQKGEHPLLFIGIPHVLHKGSIDVSNLPVISV